MACVFGGAVINFWHLGYDKTFTDRVSFGWFEGGHMMYTRPSAHKALKTDIAKFIADTAGAHVKASTQQP
jgi:carboxypeptidase C (cathepsin A)